VICKVAGNNRGRGLFIIFTGALLVHLPDG